MAIRVTSDEVLEIMDSDISISETQMTALVTGASIIIDNVFENDTEVTDSLLKELERWLTAHFITSTLARMTDTEKVGEAQVKYIGKWGEGLRSTPYGQMVLTLDITGKLAKTGKMGASMYAIPNFDE